MQKIRCEIIMSESKSFKKNGNVLKNSWWCFKIFFVIFLVNLKRKQALLKSNLPAIRLMATIVEAT